MADERVEIKCLSPFEWRFGWLKGLFIFLTFILAVVALQSRARGFDFSLPAALALVPIFCAAYFWPARASLLEDGISYKRYGFTKFIPYSKIRKTESLQRLGAGTGSSKEKDTATYWTVYCAIRLHFEGGGTLDIGTGTEELKTGAGVTRSNLAMGAYGQYGVFDRNGWELKKALDARVDASHVQAVREPQAPAAVGLLRGEKTVAEWLAAIEAASPARRGDHEVAYRGADGAEEALWRVLEDDASPREARAAAALALRAHLDEEGRHRMRVVVDTCESPKLRVALETALDDEAGEPRLLHALEQASLPREE